MPKKKCQAQADEPVVPLIVYDLAQLAKALHISRWSAQQLVASGHIPRLNLPAVSTRRRGDSDAPMKRVLVAAEDVTNFIQRHRD